jgi:hypothetical protein
MALMETVGCGTWTATNRGLAAYRASGTRRNVVSGYAVSSGDHVATRDFRAFPPLRGLSIAGVRRLAAFRPRYVR